jgi:hypothetical protein
VALTDQGGREKFELAGEVLMNKKNVHDSRDNAD